MSTDSHETVAAPPSDDIGLAATAPHDDKYSDPRVSITRRGVLIGVGVVLFGIAGSALSIWARKTRLEKSTEFWGAEVIEAFQLAEEFELIAEPEDASAEPVRLSGMPGLGHLRHALLDDRSYQWESVQDTPIGDRVTGEPYMILRLTDPTANRFPEARVVLTLDSGWLGLEGGTRQVRFTERFRGAVPTYLRRIANYEPLRSEVRAEKARERQAD